jgi:uncharacterized protein YjiS (DUF1127 family)
MPAKFLAVFVEPLRGWLHRRAERKALLMATDGLGHSPEAFLTDIGVSHDDIMVHFADAKSRLADRSTG